MALNTASTDALLRRRETVARFRLHGLSQREIVTALADLKDKDGEPDPIMVSVATVNRDLKIMTAEWRTRAAEDIATRKSRQLAEIDEAKRRAWATNDIANLAKFIKLESDIFGTNSPLKIVEVPWEELAQQWGIDAGILTTSFEQALIGKPVNANVSDDDTD